MSCRLPAYARAFGRELRGNFAVSSDRTIALLDDMIDSIERIRKQLAVMKDWQALQSSQDAMDIVCWNFMRLGEAASQLPMDFREAHSELAWHKASGMRNHIVHGYRDVDAAILWDT